MKNFFLFITLFSIVSCGPSQEEKINNAIKTSDSFFKRASEMSDIDPCKKLAAFEKMFTHNKRNGITNNSIAARKEMKPLENDCQYSNARMRSLEREQLVKNQESVVFSCSNPKMVEKNAHANQATYIITGNWLGRQDGNYVFGYPGKGEFSKNSENEIFIRLFKEPGSENYENYDSFILNKRGEISHVYRSIGDGFDLSAYNIDLGKHTFFLMRDNFNLITSVIYDTKQLSYSGVGQYTVEWTYKYQSQCEISQINNLHNYLFEKADIKRAALKKQELEKIKKEKESKDKKINEQKKNNKI